MRMLNTSSASFPIAANTLIDTGKQTKIFQPISFKRKTSA